MTCEIPYRIVVTELWGCEPRADPRIDTTCSWSRLRLTSLGAPGGLESTAPMLPARSPARTGRPRPRRACSPECTGEHLPRCLRAAPAHKRCGDGAGPRGHSQAVRRSSGSAGGSARRPFGRGIVEVRHHCHRTLSGGRCRTHEAQRTDAAESDRDVYASFGEADARAAPGSVLSALPRKGSASTRDRVPSRPKPSSSQRADLTRHMAEVPRPHRGTSPKLQCSNANQRPRKAADLRFLRERTTGFNPRPQPWQGGIRRPWHDLQCRDLRSRPDRCPPRWRKSVSS